MELARRASQSLCGLRQSPTPKKRRATRNPIQSFFVKREESSVVFARRCHEHGQCAQHGRDLRKSAMLEFQRINFAKGERLAVHLVEELVRQGVHGEGEETTTAVPTKIEVSNFVHPLDHEDPSSNTPPKVEARFANYQGEVRPVFFLPEKELTPDKITAGSSSTRRLMAEGWPRCRSTVRGRSRPTALTCVLSHEPGNFLMSRYTLEEEDQRLELLVTSIS